MPVIANGSGVATGKFTIPAGLPAGTKRVSFSGSGGSRGDAIFVGTGTVTDEVRRLVRTLTTTRFLMPGVDPLAQTFSIPETCQIAAVDLWFSAKGDSPVIVQIRETSVGLPNQSVIADARLSPDDINTVSHTPVNFSAPVSLLANTEYALVVLCDDADTELRIAELGKWDPTNGRWVTSQPYQIGVLMSSSNASTWTPHQDRDMAFRIHRAVFTESERTIALGTVAVTDATDLMLLAIEDTPSSQTRIVYTVTLPGGDVLTVSNGQPIRLPDPVTGDVTVSARLVGSADASPILHPATQLVVGHVETTATYVSRAIKGGTGIRVKVVFDGVIPGGSTVSLHYKGADGGDTWQSIPYVSATPIDDGFMEVVHQVTPVTEDFVQIRMTLTGTSSARPRVKNLRFMTI